MSGSEHPQADSQWRPSREIGPSGLGPRQLDAERQADATAWLEWLDDLMFAAIDGDPVALEAAAEAWTKALAELGTHVVEESRRQYLRRAQSVWNSLRNEPNHPPHKVFAAIEVISLLADKAW